MLDSPFAQAASKSLGELDTLTANDVRAQRKQRITGLYVRPVAKSDRMSRSTSGLDKLDSPTKASMSPTKPHEANWSKAAGKYKINQVLPVQQDIVQDCDQSASLIIKGVMSALEKRDPDAIAHYVNLISRHLDLGYPIPSEDRGWLVRHLYYTAVLPHTDHNILQVLCRAIFQLGKQKERIPDLVLDWRPAHQLLQTLYFRKQRSQHLPKKEVTMSLVEALKVLRRYWSPEAPQQILSLTRPMLCLLDPIIFRAQGLISLFMPTDENCDDCDWLDEFMGFWNWVDNSPSWDFNHVALLSRVAKDKIGQINWEDHLSTLYSNSLRILNLPSGSTEVLYDIMGPDVEQTLFFPGPGKDMQIPAEMFPKNLPALTETAKLLVYTLHTPGASEKLSRLFSTVHLFLHPNNSGPWTMSLAVWMNQLAENYVQLWYNEREIAGKSLERFVDDILPLALTAMYHPHPIMSKAGIEILNRLLRVKPQQLLPVLLQRVQTALTTLTQPHQTMAVIDLLSFIVVPLLFKSDEVAAITSPKSPAGGGYSEFGYGGYPSDEPVSGGQEGLQTVLDLLYLVIPSESGAPGGIDACDVPKTNDTLKFLYSLLMLLPFNTNHGAMEPQLEAWSLAFLERILKLLEELPAMSRMEALTGGPENVQPGMLKHCLDLFWSVLTPDLFIMCLDKLQKWLFDGIKSKSPTYVGYLVDSACWANPEVAYPKLLSVTLGKVLNDKNQPRDLSSGELNWYMVIIISCIRRGGKHTLKFRSQIDPLIEALWGVNDDDDGADDKKQESIRSDKMCSKLLRRLLGALCDEYLLEAKPYNPSSEEAESGGRLHGNMYTAETAKLSWHQPTATQVGWAVDVANKYITEAFKCMDKFQQGKQDQAAVDKVNQTVVKLAALMKGGCLLFPPPTKTSTELARKYFTPKLRATWLVDRQFEDGANPIVSSPLKFTREQIITKCCEVATTITNGDCLNVMAVKVFSTMLPQILDSLPFNQETFMLRFMGLKQFKKILQYKDNDNTKLIPRPFLALCAAHHIKKRFVWQAMYQHATPTHVEVLTSLRTMALSPHCPPDCRKDVVNGFNKVLDRLPRHMTHPLIEEVIEQLPMRSKAVPEDKVFEMDTHIENVVRILTLPSVMKCIVGRWEVLPKFLATVCTIWEESSKAEGQIAELMQRFNIEYYGISLDTSLPVTNADEGGGIDGIEECLACYHDALENLVKIGSDSTLHWKIKERVLSILFLLMRTPAMHDTGVRVPESVTRFVLQNVTSDVPRVRTTAVACLDKLFNLYKPAPSQDDTLQRSPGGSLSDGSPGSQQQLMASSGSLSMLTGNKHSSHELIELPIPQTEEEFNSAVWFDKACVGFYAMPDLAMYREIPSLLNDVVGPSVADQEQFLDCLVDVLKTTLPQFLEYLCQDFAVKFTKRAGYETVPAFSSDAAQFFKGFFQVLGVSLLRPIDYIVNSWLSTHNENNGQLVILADMVGGLLRAVQRFSFTETGTAWTWMLTTISKAEAVSSQSEWEAFEGAFEFGATNQDPRRLAPLVNWIFPKVEQHAKILDDNSVLRPLLSINSILPEFSWKARNHARKILPIVGPLVCHDYEQIRTAASSIISTVYKLECTLPHGEGGKLHLDSPETKYLSDFLDQITRSTDKQKRDAQSTQKINRAIVGWFESQSTCTLAVEPYVLQYLKVVGGYLREDHDMLLLNRMNSVMIRLIQGNYSRDCIESIWKWLHSELTSGDLDTEFKHVPTVLNLVQILLQRSTFFFDDTNTALGQDIADGILGLLTHNNPPITMACVQCVAMMVKVMPHEVRKYMEEKLAHWTKGEDTAKKTAACLGLSGILRAFPFSLPDEIPPIVTLLAKQINTVPAQISSQLKQVFAEWYRTHQDGWDVEYKHKFTEDELSVVTNVLYAPSFYA